jgi:hypothetical protein
LAIILGKIVKKEFEEFEEFKELQEFENLGISGTVTTQFSVGVPTRQKRSESTS